MVRGPGVLVSYQLSFGSGGAKGVEVERLGVEPGGDRERQILWRSGVGSLSSKAQRVGGMSESSTSRRSFAGEALAVKNRGITDSAGSAKNSCQFREADGVR
jgi:hypothetical protein